jgi:short/branched chain acyl-CoA dehydrogenase
MLRDTVRQFAEDKMLPLVSEMDKKGELNLELLTALFDAGLMGVETPAELGGMGMTFTEACIVIEELARVDPAISVICDIQNTLINTIMRKHSSPALQQHYLPLLAQSRLASFCLSESESGSDAFALKTTATATATNPNGRDGRASQSDHPASSSRPTPPLSPAFTEEGEGYLLNGTKMWISNAKEADVFLVFATVDKEKKHKGITVSWRTNTTSH